MLEYDPNDKCLHSINDVTGVDEGVFCEGFFVTCTYSDAMTGKESVSFKAYTKAGAKTFLVPAEDISVNKLHVHLLSHGVNYLNALEISQMIVAYALDSKKDAPVKISFSRLGWDTYKGRRAYLGATLRCGSQVLKNCKYTLHEKIDPKGDFSSWINGIKPFIQRPEVVLALITAASAPIIPLLKSQGLFSDTLVFSFIGKSSTYKTTMLKLGASIYGKPSIGDGIIDTTFDTDGYFFQGLGKKNGFVHLVDDISASPDHDFTRDIYLISMGKSRGRLKPDGEPRKIETWCTTVIYTGETSIFEQTNKNTGLFSRLIEFNHMWLSEEDDVNALYSVIENNYGVALKPLIKTLFKLSEEEIRELYKVSIEKACDELKPTDGVSRRIALRYGILLMTLLICNVAWNLDLKIPPVMELLKTSYEKNRPQYDPVDDAIQKIKEELTSNGKMFVNSSSKSHYTQSIWGVYGEYKKNKCLWIMENKMLEIAKFAKVDNFLDLRKSLADRRFLVRDGSNHYVFSKNFPNNLSNRCYGILLLAPPKTPPKTRKAVSRIVKGSKAEILTAEEESCDD